MIAADDFLGDPVTDIPDSSPMSGLQGKVFENFFNSSGTGSLRIMAQHRPDRIDTSFLNKHRINILLNGHRHNPFYEYVGATPTLSSRPGAVCRSGEIKNWKETLGFFRIFYVHSDTFSCTPPLRFCKNPTADFRQLELNLTMDYKNPNDGTAGTNEVIIRNLLPVDLPGCRIRFVMKDGEYRVTGGTIRQIVHTGKFTVVDVNADAVSMESREIKIFPVR